MKPGTKDEIAGKIHEVKGAVKEKVGKLTNNPDLEAEGTVEKVLNTLTFRGSIGRRIEHICARCLKAVEEDVTEPFDLVLDIKGLLEINLLGDIRDALVLSHPDRFLCSLDCKGLCPNCGTDLNVGQCQCQNRTPSHPFSNLKKEFGSSNIHMLS